MSQPPKDDQPSPRFFNSEPRTPYRVSGDGTQSRAVRSAPFSGVPAQSWADWQWHVRNRITGVSELEKWLPLTVEEKRAIRFSRDRSHFSLSPYWVSLMDPADVSCPIRRQAIPLDEEFRTSAHESYDLTNEGTRVAHGRLTHLFQDRAILSAHSRCIVYCRFCPQRKIQENKNGAQAISSVGGFQESSVLTEEDWKEISSYLAGHPHIQEVIISGGEPLLLRDELLRDIFSRLRAVPSVKSLRLETRILSVLPQRVTDALARMLREFQPFYLAVHVNHPREITPEFAEAAARLADQGVPLVSQTVLLREINDKSQVLSELFSTLFKMRVRPYRLVQCVPSQGMDHFRANVSLGLRLIELLRARMTALALPEYVVETAGGKIPLRYESILSRNRKRVMLKNYEGKVFVYPEKSFSF